MTPNEYQSLALRTEADQGAILLRLASELGPAAMRLDNAVRGLAADAGEVADVVQKYVEYGRPLDRTHLIEECGDVLWRVAQALAAVGATLEEAMTANLRKLAVRYPGKYTDERANNRDAAAERSALEYDGPISAGTLGGTIPADATHEERWAVGMKAVGELAAARVSLSYCDGPHTGWGCTNCVGVDGKPFVWPSPVVYDDPEADLPGDKMRKIADSELDYQPGKWDDPNVPPGDRSGS